MGDVHYIVEKLGAPPFNYAVDLVKFTEKSCNDLLQLTSDVFSTISSKHSKVVVSTEGIDYAVERITNFLKIVKYKPTVDGALFRQLLGAGDKDVIYHILKWVLSQPQVLEKRSMVGYYMSLPDMPEELNYDADVMEIKEEIKQLQQEFVEVRAPAPTCLSLKTQLASRQPNPSARSTLCYAMFNPYAPLGIVFSQPCFLAGVEQLLVGHSILP